MSRTTNQEIDNETWTNISFDTEDRDDAGFADLGTDATKITIPTGYGGTFRVNVYWNFEANATGQRQVKVYLNGGATNLVTEAHAAHALGFACTTTGEGGLSATNYIQVAVWQNSGGALDLTPSYVNVKMDR